LLRACSERPRRRPAEQGDKAAPFQLIKFRQVAAIRKACSIPQGGNKVRTRAVQYFGRAAVRCGSKREFPHFGLMSASSASSRHWIANASAAVCQEET
jgi:hypothetical protein